MSGNGDSEVRFLGKFRGLVSDAQDPLMLGRIRAQVPDVLGDQESGWAMPAAPFGGSAAGFFALPSVGSGVWIEFEQGDPDFPVWTGSWWGTAADVPPALLAPPYEKVLVQTAGGHSITLDDTPGVGGITLQTATGQKITLNALGIEIDNGMGAAVKLEGPVTTINDDGLQVI